MLRLRLQQVVAGLAIWVVSGPVMVHAQTQSPPGDAHVQAAQARIAALEAELRALRTDRSAMESSRRPAASVSDTVPQLRAVSEDQRPAVSPAVSEAPEREVSAAESDPLTRASHDGRWRRRGLIAPAGSSQPVDDAPALPPVAVATPQTEIEPPAVTPVSATASRGTRRLVLREHQPTPLPPAIDPSLPVPVVVRTPVPASEGRPVPAVAPKEEDALALRMSRLEREIRAMKESRARQQADAVQPTDENLFESSIASGVSEPTSTAPSSGAPRPRLAETAVSENDSEQNSSAAAEKGMLEKNPPESPAAAPAKAPPPPAKPSAPPADPLAEELAPSHRPEAPAAPRSEQRPHSSESSIQRDLLERDEAERRARRLNDIAQTREEGRRDVQPASALRAAPTTQLAQEKPQVAPAPPPDPYDEPTTRPGMKPLNLKSSAASQPPGPPAVESTEPAVARAPMTSPANCRPCAPRVASKRSQQNLAHWLQNSQFGTVFEDSGTTFYAGYDLLFVQPSFANSDALHVQTGAATSVTQDFDYDFELTPRVVGGFVLSSGIGARFQFWQYDHATQAAAGPSNGALAITSPPITPFGTLPVFLSLAAPGAGQTLRAEHSLQLATYDLEGTRQLRVGSNAVTLGGGVRYLKMEQRYDVQRIEANGALSGDLSHDHDFEGFGPTLGAEWLSPFGDSGFAFYASARGSVLFGTRDQTVTRLDPLSVNPVVRDDHLNQGAQVGIGEIGVGLQYGLDSLVLRAGYEAQIWTDVGSATSAVGNMGLQGLFASFGFSY